MSERVVHCKRSKHDVYIGRPSKWGNPFPVPKGYDRVADPERILERFEAYVRGNPKLMADLHELAGKVLGCWCAPQRCHGDVLVRLADEAEGHDPWIDEPLTPLEQAAVLRTTSPSPPVKP